jgi:hypothetical protein
MDSNKNERDSILFLRVRARLSDETDTTSRPPEHARLVNVENMLESVLAAMAALQLKDEDHSQRSGEQARVNVSPLATAVLLGVE